jgi:hypothetical protein
LAELHILQLIEMAQTSAIPFHSADQLNFDLDWLSQEKQPISATPITFLPGHPRISLEDTGQLRCFLAREFETPDLDRMAPYLWMMSTYSSSNINPLHAQKLKGRAVVITENPRLHLVWIHDRIFIKPIPKYLFSHNFWSHFLSRKASRLGPERESIQRAARGFLRTYVYLIQYESDFRIAQEHQLQLVPSSVTWEGFSRFMAQAHDILDSEVSPRYSYGEMRLTRLNFYCKFFLRRFQYERYHGQYSSFFSRFYVHFLFAFAILSIVLNAMQVELVVEQLHVAQWTRMWTFSRWFSVICLVATLLLVVSLISLVVGMIVDEWIFAIKTVRRKRLERANWRTQQSP